MSAFHDYRLTGGIFYAFLVDCMYASQLFIRPPHNKKRITQPEVLCDLFRVFNPSFYYIESEKGSVDTKSSTFKKCESNDKDYFLNVDGETQLVEKETVISNTTVYLSRFNAFINKYRITKAPTHTKTLARRLLDLLSLDDSIPADEPLYVQEDGTALKKSELLKTDTINCIPFLFGVWFYVCFRNENNTIGKDTYNYFWTNPKTEKHSIRVYKDNDPPLGSKFEQMEIIVPEREAAQNDITDDESQDDDLRSNRPLDSFTERCVDELRNDFYSLLCFCINNNPYEAIVRDCGELAAIQVLLSKWKTKCLIIEYQPLKELAQNLMALLDEYLSFYQNPHLVFQNGAFIPMFNSPELGDLLRDELQPHAEDVRAQMIDLYAELFDLDVLE